MEGGSLRQRGSLRSLGRGRTAAAAAAAGEREQALPRRRRPVLADTSAITRHLAPPQAPPSAPLSVTRLENTGGDSCRDTLVHSPSQHHPHPQTQCNGDFAARSLSQMLNRSLDLSEPRPSPPSSRASKPSGGPLPDPTAAPSAAAASEICRGDGRSVVLSETESGCSRVALHAHFLSPCRADHLFQQINQRVQFEPFYREGQLVREMAWFGSVCYSYSGLRHQPNRQWPEYLLRIKADIEAAWHRGGGGGVQSAAGQLPVVFNSLLINRYLTLDTCCGWHADDEECLGREPVIGSLSLGATRVFELRPAPHRPARQQQASLRVPLPSGSLLFMSGATQRDWQHRVPKQPSSAIQQCRINLTFRQTHA